MGTSTSRRSGRWWPRSPGLYWKDHPARLHLLALAACGLAGSVLVTLSRTAPRRHYPRLRRYPESSPACGAFSLCRAIALYAPGSAAPGAHRWNTGGYRPRSAARGFPGPDRARSAGSCAEGDAPHGDDTAGHWSRFEPLIGHASSAGLRGQFARIRRLKPAQIADLLGEASKDEETEILGQVHSDPELEADVFEELDEDRATRLLSERSDAEIAEVLSVAH
jgi:hypothetical protein